MRAPKAKWKRAPIAQRRVSSERSVPKARFTRSQRSSSLPASLSSGGNRYLGKPLLILGGVVLLISLGVALVIAVGAYIRADQSYQEIAWRSTYYGLPTQPFATPMPPVNVAENTAEVAATDELMGWQGRDVPTLAAADDPRWVVGSATPLRTSFAVRGAPTLTAAVLQAIGEPTAVSFISEVDWGVWAQVKIGDTIGWVDASSVRLEATP